MALVCLAAAGAHGGGRTQRCQGNELIAYCLGVGVRGCCIGAPNGDKWTRTASVGLGVIMVGVVSTASVYTLGC